MIQCKDRMNLRALAIWQKPFYLKMREVGGLASEVA